AHRILYASDIRSHKCFERHLTQVVRQVKPYLPDERFPDVYRDDMGEIDSYPFEQKKRREQDENIGEVQFNPHRIQPIHQKTEISQMIVFYDGLSINHLE